jgi:hypothetical protein
MEIWTDETLAWQKANFNCCDNPHIMSNGSFNWCAWCCSLQRTQDAGPDSRWVGFKELTDLCFSKPEVES